MDLPQLIIALGKKVLGRLTTDVVLLLIIVGLMYHNRTQELHLEKVYVIKDETTELNTAYIRNTMLEAIRIGEYNGQRIFIHYLDSMKNILGNNERLDSLKEKCCTDFLQYKSALQYNIMVYTFEETKEYVKINGYHALRSEPELLDQYIRDRSKQLLSHSSTRINNNLPEDNIFRDRPDRFPLQNSYNLYKKLIQKVMQYERDENRKLEELYDGEIWLWKFFSGKTYRNKHVI